MVRLSQLMTESSGNPSTGPTGTSDRIPLIVRVIGERVTEARAEAAAFRVTTQTGSPSRGRTEISPVDLAPCGHLPGGRRAGGEAGGRLKQRGIRG